MTTPTRRIQFFSERCRFVRYDERGCGMSEWQRGALSLDASGIPGAEFVELDSRNHILLEHEAAWQRFREAVLGFLQSDDVAVASLFAALSARERQVLALIADG